METNIKKFGLLGAVIAMTIILVVFLQWPTHKFTLDVNPSLEISSNRLEKVTKIEGLNEDGREFLEGYEMNDRHLEAVINDLVDRMILTGYISGGKDNIVMITVKNDELNESYVEKVNVALAALLENKQLEYTILLQGWTELYDRDDNSEVSRGKRILVEKLIENNESLSYDELAQVSIRDLLITAEKMNLSPNELFARINKSNTSEPGKSEIISLDKAIEIALAKVGGGTVTEFEYDREEAEYEIEIKFNGLEYELEIDAYTGEIKEFESEKDDDKFSGSSSKENLISLDKTIAIALAKVGGGTVTEFEYDREEAEYEIKIEFNGKEYELEIDANTGEIKEFESDKDDSKFSESSSNQTLITRDKAIEIALAKVGGGTVKEFEYDREEAEYEIEIEFNGKEYEVEIDAYTGEIKD